MAVRVTAATSKGEILSTIEWEIVEKGCEMMFGLDDAKRIVSIYILNLGD